MSQRWPSLELDEWADTQATLHMWTQIVGKIRMARTPWVNHAWSVPLYLTLRGLTTSPIAHDRQSFAIDFDFVDHRLVVAAEDGRRSELALRPRSVADLYAELMQTLRDMDLPVEITTGPCEVPDGIPFDQDTVHDAYDPEYANRFWRVLIELHRLMTEFRAQFLGKTSPIHFFWGAFDLALTRFSGREAPPHPGGMPAMPDWVARESYSHEVSSSGFWPGGGPLPFPVIYSYAYPAPDGFAEAAVDPDLAAWSDALGEFYLPYQEVRRLDDPDAAILAFLQSSYAAAADLAGWERESLERHEPPPFTDWLAARAAR